MNSILATEPTTAPDERRTPLPLPPLETWSDNDRMRHVPPLDWMIRKLDGDLRTRVSKLAASFGDLSSADPRSATIENELRLVGGAIDRLATTAGGRRSNETPGVTLPGRIDAALTHAIACLRSLESTPFGRRAPYHFFDRSKSEPVYGALLAIIFHVERLVPLIRVIDGDIDEKLLA